MNNDLLSTEEAKKTSLNELEQRLSSSESGISSQEAAKRFVQYGYNEISEKKTSPILKFLGYFWGPIPWMIEIAAVLSAIIQHWEDFWIIFVLLLLNASVGFWQEHKAENAIELLKKKLALKAKVLRDGKLASGKSARRDEFLKIRFYRSQKNMASGWLVRTAWG